MILPVGPGIGRLVVRLAAPADVGFIGFGRAPIS
jgi:hypothetical protein